MRGYPIYSAIVFGVIILAGGWRARTAPQRVGAALWVTAAAATAFAAADLFVAPQAPPGLRDVQPGVSVLYQVVSGFPPPSGAAAMAGAVAAGLFLVYGRAGIAATITATAMMAFQVWVVSYAWQDVVAGFVFGIAIMGGGYAILADPLARAAGPLVRASGGPADGGPADGGPAAGGPAAGGARQRVARPAWRPGAPGS